MADGVRSTRRPIAEAFDLVLSEYSGYTDETLLDVTLDRLRQMVDVINERKHRELLDDRKWQLQMAEIMVKSHGSILPGLAQNKKTADSMQKVIQSMKIAGLLDDKDEQEQAKEDRVPSTASVMRAFGVKGGTGLAAAKA